MLSGMVRIHKKITGCHVSCAHKFTRIWRLASISCLGFTNKTDLTLLEGNKTVYQIWLIPTERMSIFPHISCSKAECPFI